VICEGRRLSVMKMIVCEEEEEEEGEEEDEEESDEEGEESIEFHRIPWIKFS
jgi:hypothetical protein